MRKYSILLSVLALAAMILAACGGQETSTTSPSTNIPPTTEVTETTVSGSATATEVATATEMPTEANATSTAGIPVTGGAGADRLSNELDYKVLDQSGKQVGKVEDMVLDLSKAKVLYVIVGTSGFLDIGKKKIAVPWTTLSIGPDSTNSNADKKQNAFLLQTDTDTFTNAPEFDVKNVPGLGQEPDSWDIAMRKYWSSGGTSSSRTGQGSGTGQGASTIQGVQLASKVIGAKLTVGPQTVAPSASTPVAATSTLATGAGAATSTPAAGSGVATSTSVPSTDKTPTALAASTPAKNVNAKIDDLIVNNDAGDVMYLVLKANLRDGDHLIPVPLGLLKLDVENEVFLLDIDPAMLETAPSFKENEFPDLTTPGWNSDLDSFWQNNGSDGSGGGVKPTATP